MKKTMVTIALFFISALIFSQENFLKSISDTQNISAEVTSSFKDNKISKAFEKLKPYWPLPDNEIDVLEEKTIKYLNVINERFGKSIGVLKVKNETISDIAIRETFLVRYENTAIRLIFTYYKNDKGWIINAFKWDDSFSKEFE